VSGLRLTLPTESQWEVAARGGQEGKEYPWGAGFDRDKLWCSNTSFGDAGRTAPVSRSERIHRNDFGLTDMSGNVWQWCLDWYGPYSPGDATNPSGPASGKEKVLRGGSWSYDLPFGFRCAYRLNWYAPGGRHNGGGFRLAAPGP